MSEVKPGFAPDDVRTRAVGAASTLLRLWWVPLLIGILVGAGVAASTREATSSATSAIINTRAASQLPNERIDLVKDLAAVMSLSPVLQPVAKANDMSERELRDTTTIEQVKASSLARISVNNDQGEEFRRSLIKQLLASGTEYLTPPSPPPVLANALDNQKRAVDAYYDAIEENGTIAPTETLKTLQDRLLAARKANDKVLLKALGKQAPRAIKKARKFELIKLKMSQANADLNSVSANAKNTIWRGPSALEVNYEENLQTGLTSALPLRRGLAAGLAAALIAGGFILLAGLARRRER